METVVFDLSQETIPNVDRLSRMALADMKNTDLLCDAVIKTEDGGSYSVHRAVMSICSQYFRALFSPRFKRHPLNIFVIPGISSGLMSELVDFAYTGQAKITDESVIEVLLAADQFNVLGLLEECVEFLTRKMNIGNCISLRNFARNYFCLDLERKAEEFLLTHFVEVSEESEEYLDMPIEEVSALLNSDRINVQNEEAVWEAGLRWIDKNPEERKQYIGLIMRSVRLGLLDTQYFMDHVKVHRYVDNNESCKPIIIDTLKFLWDLEMIGQKTAEVETPFLAVPRIPYSILFSIGGWSGGSPTDLIETYDTKADRWIQVDATDPAGPRAYHKMAVIGYSIYVIGGFNGNEPFSSCRRFDAVTKTWSAIAPMHCKRCYVSVATLNDLIYALGGYDGHHRQNTVERYDYRTNQWTLVAPMNVQRSDASATSLNGLIYIVGGFNGRECLTSSEFYDPTTNHWTNIAPMRQRRSGVSVIAYHGRIYALGGFNGISRLSSGERYDVERDAWTDVPDMFNQRSNFGIEVMDDMIFVIGGFNGVTTIFHVECFDERTGEWYEATDMNTYRSALAACVVPGLPNVNDYVHQNRRGLMEEKRQKMIQQPQSQPQPPHPFNPPQVALDENGNLVDEVD